MNFITLFLTIIGATLSYGITINTTCPFERVDAISNFNAGSYLGNWYEIARYEQEFQIGADCNSANYYGLANGSVLVENSQVNFTAGDGLQSRIGLAVLADPNSGVGKLNVSFNGLSNDRTNYWVIDTNYVDYSIVWNCVNSPNETTSSQSAWILSRNAKLNAAVQGVVNFVIDRYLQLDRSLIRQTFQGDECHGDTGPYFN